MNVLASLLVSLAALQAPRDGRPGFDSLPEATRERLAAIILEMDRSIGGPFPPGWSPDERFADERTQPSDAEPGGGWWLRFSSYRVILDADGRTVRSLMNWDYIIATPLPANTVTASESETRAMALMSRLEPGWTFDVIGVVDRHNYWLVWMRPLHRGLPFGNFGAQCLLPVSKHTGRVLDYSPVSAPAPDDACRAVVGPYDAQTAAGIALAGRPGPATWRLGEARLVWMDPGGGPERLRWNERYERWRREGMAGLFYEVWGRESLETGRDDAILGRSGPVYVDVETGEAALMWVHDGGLLGGGPAPVRAPKGLPHGPATVLADERRQDVYRAAIWWTPAKAPPDGVEVRIVAPGRAMRLRYDAVHGLLVDPDTSAVGLPSPSLRRARPRGLGLRAARAG
jgi:hypothetical protein